MSRWYASLLVSTFCALIALPGASLLIGPQPQQLSGVSEVTCPPFEPSLEWLRAAEQCFVANFGRKRQLVQLHNWLGYFVIGDLQSDSVLAGRDGWLFLKQSFGWESFRSEHPLAEAEREGWARSLRVAQRELAQRQIPLLYVIVPSKESVHPEYLPSGVRPARSVSRADEMLPQLRAAGIEPLDLRAPLREAAATGALYDKLDSHWNGRGGDIAARLILEHLTALLARPPEYAVPTWHLAQRPSPNDLGSLLALDEYLSESSTELLPNAPRAVQREPRPGAPAPKKRIRRHVFEVDDPSLPRALILRDSFGTLLMPPLAEKFRRSVWLWTRDFDFRVLDEEQPDVVLYQITERMFQREPPQVLLPRKRR